MATPPAERVVVVAGASPDVKVTSWPLRDSPLAARSILAAAILASLAAGYFTGSIWIALLCMALLLATLWRIWTPIEVRLYELGIVQKAFGRTWRVPWRAIAKYRTCNHGILLLPGGDESGVDQLKGLYIPWQDQKDEMLTALAHYLADGPPEQGEEVATAEPPKSV